MIADDEAGTPLELPAPIAELSAMYPVRDEAAWNALVAKIVVGAAPGLARRRGERAVVRSLLRWSRPVAAAAAAVLLFGAGALTLTSDAEAMAPAAPSFAEVVDREPATVLLMADRPPSANDLATALEGDSLQQVEP
jgi:hypothetical protein